MALTASSKLKHATVLTNVGASSTLTAKVSSMNEGNESMLVPLHDNERRRQASEDTDGTAHVHYEVAEAAHVIPPSWRISSHSLHRFDNDTRIADYKLHHLDITDPSFVWKRISFIPSKDEVKGLALMDAQFVRHHVVVTLQAYAAAASSRKYAKSMASTSQHHYHYHHRHHANLTEMCRPNWFYHVRSILSAYSISVDLLRTSLAQLTCFELDVLFAHIWWVYYYKYQRHPSPEDSHAPVNHELLALLSTSLTQVHGAPAASASSSTCATSSSFSCSLMRLMHIIQCLPHSNMSLRLAANLVIRELDYSETHKFINQLASQLAKLPTWTALHTQDADTHAAEETKDAGDARKNHRCQMEAPAMRMVLYDTGAHLVYTMLRHTCEQLPLELDRVLLLRLGREKAQCDHHGRGLMDRLHRRIGPDEKAIRHGKRRSSSSSSSLSTSSSREDAVRPHDDEPANHSTVISFAEDHRLQMLQRDKDACILSRAAEYLYGWVLVMLSLSGLCRHDRGSSTRVGGQDAALSQQATSVRRTWLITDNLLVPYVLESAQLDSFGLIDAMQQLFRDMMIRWNYWKRHYKHSALSSSRSAYPARIQALLTPIHLLLQFVIHWIKHWSCVVFKDDSIFQQWRHSHPYSIPDCLWDRAVTLSFTLQPLVTNSSSSLPWKPLPLSQRHKSRLPSKSIQKWFGCRKEQEERLRLRRRLFYAGERAHVSSGTRDVAHSAKRKRKRTSSLRSQQASSEAITARSGDTQQEQHIQAAMSLKHTYATRSQSHVKRVRFS